MKRLGIDVGGSSIKVAVLSDRGIRSTFLKTPATLAGFKNLLSKIVQDYGGQGLQHIGIGIPGLVDSKSGKIKVVSNLKYLDGFNPRKYLKNVFVKIENDAKCRFHAELAYGSAAKYKNAIMISVGTGIGGAISMDHKLYLGAGSAGEFGHMVLDRGMQFEDLAGGKSLKKFNTAEFKRVGHYLGLACANFINIFDPEIIILAGGVIESHYGQIKPHLSKPIRANVLDTARLRKIKIVKSELSEFSGAIGAALL